jgi:hypothetical protein
MTILHDVTAVKVLGHYRLQLTFDDGTDLLHRVIGLGPSSGLILG